MKYGYARVSTDGQSVDAQVRQLTKAGCKKVFREVASGAKTNRAQLRRLLDQLEAGGPNPAVNAFATGVRPGVNALNGAFTRYAPRNSVFARILLGANARPPRSSFYDRH